MNDRECLHFLDVTSYMHCGKLRCILCHNWHLKWAHGAQFVHDETTETQFSFYPKEVPDSILDKMSDSQLLELAEQLRLKIDKEQK